MKKTMSEFFSLDEKLEQFSIHKNKVKTIETIPNATLDKIEKIFVGEGKENWPTLYNDLVFDFSKSGDKIEEGFVYKAKKQEGEENFGDFKVFKLELNANKFLLIGIELVAPYKDGFFKKMRDLHLFYFEEDGSLKYTHQMFYEPSHTILLDLNSIIEAMMNRVARRLVRLLVDPKSYDIEKELRQNSYEENYDQGFRGLSISYKSSFPISEIWENLTDLNKIHFFYSRVEPKSEIKSENEIYMTFYGPSGEKSEKMEFKRIVDEEKNSVIFSSKGKAGYFNEMQFIHRLSPSGKETLHILTIKYKLSAFSLPGGTMVANFAADRNSLVKDSIKNMIVTIMRKFYGMMNPVIQEENKKQGLNQ